MSAVSTHDCSYTKWLKTYVLNEIIIFPLLHPFNARSTHNLLYVSVCGYETI